MGDAVAVLNAGSSSVKFSLYAEGANGASLVARGQAEGLYTSPRFVAKDPHSPFVLAPLDLEHLRFVELFEPRVRQVERDGDGGGPVRGEPLVGQVEVQGKP